MLCHLTKLSLCSIDVSPPFLFLVYVWSRSFTRRIYQHSELGATTPFLKEDAIVRYSLTFPLCYAGPRSGLNKSFGGYDRVRSAQ